MSLIINLQNLRGVHYRLKDGYVLYNGVLENEKQGIKIILEPKKSYILKLLVKAGNGLNAAAFKVSKRYKNASIDSAKKEIRSFIKYLQTLKIVENTK